MLRCQDEKTCEDMQSSMLPASPEKDPRAKLGKALVKLDLGAWQQSASLFRLVKDC